MNSVEVAERKWILKGSKLTKRYGPGCSSCAELIGPEQPNQCPGCGTVTACAKIDFELAKGEIVGIVGESGSGKSTLMQMVNLGLSADSGKLLYREGIGNGEVTPTIAGQEQEINLLALNKYERRAFRNERLGIVYQRPELGLNMGFSVGGNVAEKLLLAGWRHVGHIRQRASQLMQMTELPPERIDDNPRTFSGGMLQRVQIAKALSSNPAVLLLDEVTSGLDLSVQARVLDLIKHIQWELQITMLLVSHDLGVIKQLAGRTMVMKNGWVVERGLTDQILEDPQHPYTQLLVSSAL
ncbi:MAG: ATP-binding cassette domain-containing protein [Ktedonobacteraceae bacterium]|nr:ATP-binding cassette domain-containing protein [Ktedonobacteraceae bacterium]